jgi:hypothetical protein
MGVPGDIRRDPDQHLLATAGRQHLGGDGRQPLQLVERVEDDVPDTGFECLPQLGRGLGVAVHVGPPGIETGSQGQGELAAGGHIAGQALLGQRAVDGGTGERLGGEQDVEVAMAGGQGIDE